MKEIAIRLKGRPVLISDQDINQVKFKEDIENQFLSLGTAVEAFYSNFIPGVDSINANFNFYIPASEFFNKDRKLQDENILIEIVEVLKNTVLNIIRINESSLCTLSIIKRPSNNGEYEMFVRLKRSRVGE